MNPGYPDRPRLRLVGKIVLMVALFLGLIGISFRAQAVEPGHVPSLQAAANAPNIVVFLADDMGYSDAGAFGSEISTPNIDSLGSNGLMMTNFHTMASCSPTRLELLTGVDNHRGGFGTMASQLHPTQEGQPGYEAVINDQVVTVASVLRAGGYHTFMAGKWHLGNEGGEAGNFWPNQRGFEHSFVLLPGAASNFSDRLGFSAGRPFAAYVNDGTLIPDTNGLPNDFYSTTFYTDKIISYVDQISDSKPFFAYFAYTVPHGPLQVPPDDTYVQEILADTVNYNYQAGWDVLRQRRFDRMKALGLIPSNLPLPSRWTTDPVANPLVAWDTLTPAQQAYEAKRMAIYAAMIRHLDDNIGRFIQHLKDTGKYNNTLFVFFGDNGADDLDRSSHPAYTKWFKKIGVDNSIANIGKVKSFILQGSAWAQVSSTPYWAAKATVAEGGIRNSFVASYQGPDPNNPIIPPGSKSAALGNVRDLTPTFLDYAGLLDQHPGVANPGKGQVYALDGRSLRSMWEGKVTSIYGANDYVGYEIFGTTNKALISGDGWKILRLGDFPWGDTGNEHESDQNWKLFNLNTDPSEHTDLSAQYPERFRDMQARYRAYEANVGFVSAYLRNAGSPGQTASYTFNLSNRQKIEDTFVLTCQTTWTCAVQTGAASLITTQATSSTITLQPGQTVPVTMTLTIPTTVQPDGNRYVNTIKIAAENDPSLAMDYTVITFVGETGLTAPGKTFSYTMTITNTGSSRDTFDVACESGWSCSLGDLEPPLQVTALAITLEPNKSVNLKVKVTVPATATNGLFDIAKVTITPRSTSVASTRAFLTTALTNTYVYMPLLVK